MMKDANPILEDGEILTTALHLPEDLFTRYPMKSKKEQPLFNYLVKTNTEMEYWLFQEFDNAVNFAKQLNRQEKDMILIYDVYFNNHSREYYLQKTFWIWDDGRLNFEKHGDVELHVYFYLKAGVWMNPNPEWIAILNKKHASQEEEIDES